MAKENKKVKTIEFDSDMFEEMEIFATKVKRANLTTWMKSTLVEAIADARPEEKAKLKELMGV